MRILGIDPGSRFTGYGCLQLSGRQLIHVRNGVLKLGQKDGRGGGEPSMEDRLLRLYEGLSQVIQETQPDVMSIESVFFAKNALSALKLGQARGVAILTGKIARLRIAEYSPTQVKLAVTGHGQAAKEQVARVVKMILGSGHRALDQFESYDASDALAIALCHAYNTLHQSRGFLSNSAVAK